MSSLLDTFGVALTLILAMILALGITIVVLALFLIFRGWTEERRLDAAKQRDRLD